MALIITIPKDNKQYNNNVSKLIKGCSIRSIKKIKRKKIYKKINYNCSNSFLNKE